MSALQLGPTRLPVCPIGPAIVSRRAGRLGADQCAAQQHGAEWPARQFAVAPVHRGRADHRPELRVQQPVDAAWAVRHRRSPFDAARLTGSLSGRGQRQFRGRARRPSATFRSCSARPSGAWSVQGRRRHDRRRADGRRPVGESALLSAAQRRPSADDRRRFRPRQRRRSSIPARARWSPTSRSSTASRPEPATRRSTCRNLTFGEGLQPEELTRLTEGVIALVKAPSAARAGSTGPAGARSPRPASSPPPTSTSPRRSARSRG